MKFVTIAGSVALFVLIAGWGYFWTPALWLLLFVAPLIFLLIYDLCQRRHTLLRNYPIVGHLRYLFEDFRTQIRQYFIQGDDEGVPFYREQRTIVYQRAKQEIDSHPFGTIGDAYKIGHEWLDHSINALRPADAEHLVRFGGDQCEQPYSASHFNISAMSFGALSGAAVLALNRGAKEGGFYHNTGEGGVSKYHLQYGGDLVWEIGTGYFGCRSDTGKFDIGKFAGTATGDTVKMIEIKLSQGAKPGGGGLLPGGKVTKEIATARGVPVGKDVHSPPSFDEFDSPIGLLQFLERLRVASGGKPVGMKLCVGKRVEFMAIVKAIIQTGITPDFITVDGAEGGTGAAPLELSDSIGMSLNDGLIFVHNVLVGAQLRDRIRIIASGKIITGFDIVAKLAMGADICNSARGFMFSLGCIQARVCNKNTCPTGITTTNAWRTHGLVVDDKYRRVANYHRGTIKSFLTVLAACRIGDPADLGPELLNKRVGIGDTRTYRQLYEYLEPGALLGNAGNSSYHEEWVLADAAQF